MKRLPVEIIQFLCAQGFAIVSTIDKDGFPHNACKGIVSVKRSGRVYLLDLYKAQTYANLRINPYISITAVDEHKFLGYCLKGKARIITKDRINAELLRSWEQRITSRLTGRLLKNIRDEKGHRLHPEALLPEPEYMISIKVEEVVDLTPRQIKHGKP